MKSITKKYKNDNLHFEEIKQKSNIYQEKSDKQDFYQEVEIKENDLSNSPVNYFSEGELDGQNLTVFNNLLNCKIPSTNVTNKQKEKKNKLYPYFTKIEESISDSLEKIKLDIRRKINEILKVLKFKNGKNVSIFAPPTNHRKSFNSNQYIFDKEGLVVNKGETKEKLIVKRPEIQNSFKFSISNPISLSINLSAMKLIKNNLENKNLKLNRNNFLFYFDAKEMNLHIKNITTLERYAQYLYISYSAVSADFFNNSIFVCGGNNKGSINVCAIFNLISKKVDISKKLTEKKSNVSLISTHRFIACIGGYNGRYGLNSCECYNVYSQEWKKFHNLNNGDFGITLCTDKNKFIYTVGGYESSRIEQSDISNLNNPWRIIHVNTKIIRRGYGISVHLNSREFLIIGGSMKTALSSISIFNPLQNLNHELNRSLKECEFYSSKPIYFRESIWIVDSKENKLFLINIQSLNCDKLCLDF